MLMISNPKNIKEILKQGEIAHFGFVKGDIFYNFGCYDGRVYTDETEKVTCNHCKIIIKELREGG